MARFGQLLLAAALGSVITLGAYKAFSLDKKIINVSAEGQTTPATFTSFGQQNVSTTNGAFAPVDFTLAASKTTPAVVHIKATEIANTTNPGNQFWGFPFFDNDDFSRPRGGEATGSGVIIDADGYIVTNNHVVDGADKLEITLHDQRKFEAKVVGRDPSTDLAVIKIDATGLQAVTYANSDQVKVGEWVLAVGNPLNLSSTATAGIVSAIGRNIHILKDKRAIESFIQTDAAVNPGNSGGALVNLQGELVGINTAIASPTGSYAGYAFAIPANIVKKIVEDLRTSGKVQRGYLGVSIQEVNNELAKSKSLNITQGVYVAGVQPGTSAEKVGLREGDVIVGIDGNTVQTQSRLLELVARKRPGETVNVAVNRSGSEKQFNIVLAGENDFKNFSSAAGNTKVYDELGVGLSELGSDEVQKLGISGGLKVDKIATNGLIGYYTDIRPGFIITNINNEPVASIDDFEETIANANNNVVRLEGFYMNRPNSVYQYAFKMPN